VREWTWTWTWTWSFFLWVSCGEHRECFLLFLLGTSLKPMHGKKKPTERFRRAERRAEMAAEVQRKSLPGYTPISTSYEPILTSYEPRSPTYAPTAEDIRLDEAQKDRLAVQLKQRLKQLKQFESSHGCHRTSL
jgi:hypothetical protein